MEKERAWEQVSHSKDTIWMSIVVIAVIIITITITMTMIIIITAAIIIY